MKKKEKSPAGKTKLILLIGIPLLLVLSLAFLFGKKSYKEEGQFLEEEQEEVVLEHYPVEPKEKAQALEKSAGEFKRTKRVTERGWSKEMGKPWQITTVGNPNDPNWLVYQPKNVSITIDKESKTAIVSWTEGDLPVKPFKWLVGYDSKIFDLVKSFQRDEDLKAYWISWGASITDKMPESNNKQKSIVLALDKLSQPINTLYFAIYIRTGSLEGERIDYTDYIFGDNNSSETPFSKSLTE